MVAQTKPSLAEAAAAPAARERKATPIQAVRGMNDVLPDEAALWERLEDAVREVFGQYGYRNLRVPVVEATPLFVRGRAGSEGEDLRPMWTWRSHLLSI